MSISLPRTVIALTLAAIIIAAASAGYFHDQSIKGIYQTFSVDASRFQTGINTRDAQISQLQADKSDLNRQISDLEADITILHAQVATLNELIADLQQENGNLRQQIGELQQQILQLQQEISPLQQQITQLQNTINDLNTQLSNFQSASVDGWFTFTGGGCFFGCSASLRGAWVNYGTQTASDVVATLAWWDGGTFVQYTVINVGTLGGKEIELYPIGTETYRSISLSDEVDSLTWTFDWS